MSYCKLGVGVGGWVGGWEEVPVEELAGRA